MPIRTVELEDDMKAERPQSALDATYRELNKSMEELDKVILVLRDRLEPVSVKVDGGEPAENSEKDSASCSLVRKLRNTMQHVDAMSRRVAEMTRALEI